VNFCEGVSFHLVYLLLEMTRVTHICRIKIELTLRVLMSYIYIYIYDIRSLRVNYLTLILLTWRKW
jgi:hypothetical protein